MTAATETKTSSPTPAEWAREVAARSPGLTDEQVVRLKAILHDNGAAVDAAKGLR